MGGISNNLRLGVCGLEENEIDGEGDMSTIFLLSLLTMADEGLGKRRFLVNNRGGSTAENEHEVS